MYRFLTKRIPHPWIDALYAVWYAALLVLVYYFFDRDAIDFYYLHH